MKKQNDYAHSYDSVEYTKAMKNFQRETRGIRKGSDQYEAIRNMHYQKLREEKMKAMNKMKKVAGGHVDMIAHDFKVSHESFYSLLIVVPEEVESHECVHILNYHHFPINVEEDNIYR